MKNSRKHTNLGLITMTQYFSLSFQNLSLSVCKYKQAQRLPQSKQAEKGEKGMVNANSLEFHRVFYYKSRRREFPRK